MFSFPHKAFHGTHGEASMIDPMERRRESINHAAIETNGHTQKKVTNVPSSSQEILPQKNVDGSRRKMASSRIQPSS